MLRSRLCANGHERDRRGGFFAETESTRELGHFFTSKKLSSYLPFSVALKVDVMLQIVYTINMVYEWDENKRLKNFEKHGYDLAEGQLVYESPKKITVECHRPHERRWLDIAEVGGELVTLTLAYTLRGEAVRCFSLRKASRKERSLYYEQNN